MKNNLEYIAGLFDQRLFQTLNSTLTFSEYIDLVNENPKLARNAFQMVYDMILAKGHKTFERFRNSYTHYNFFDDLEIPIFGNEEALNQLVKYFKGAAGGYGTERRVLLLHGPVGSSKSTICRLLKKGMEEYSRTDEGAWYTYRWINLPTGQEGIYTSDTAMSPMNEQPLKLIPEQIRNQFLKNLNESLWDSTPEDKRMDFYHLQCEGDLNPLCKKFMNELLTRYNGDWNKVVNKHIQVIRRVYSESDRVGLATFQPKDEKNQDATELTGDINYARLPHFGSDSDPRAFNFDGEFCAGNRGNIEFIEILKLDKAFLYDLLGATQEHRIKPKKFPQIPLDAVIISHTNPPEYQKLKNDPTMEAFRDRTVKIDVPYLLRWSDEIKILNHNYNPEKVKQHIAPHTLEIAALWAVITRLQNDKDGLLTLVDKAKLYDGRSLPGYTEDSVKELIDKYETEGMVGGISCRYVCDKISNLLASNFEGINAFQLINELRSGLKSSSLITNQDEIAKYNECLDLVQKELDEILKNEVQKALVADDKAIVRLCTNYIDNVMAYIDKAKIKNPITGKEQAADERLMRSIESKIDIPETRADDFRIQLAGFIGKLGHTGQKFTWDSNPRLRKALEAKLFEDTKDHIKLSALNISGATVVDPDIQEKIDAIKHRLITQYGYNDRSATDVLDYVGSIFARGEVINND